MRQVITNDQYQYWLWVGNKDLTGKDLPLAQKLLDLFFQFQGKSESDETRIRKSEAERAESENLDRKTRNFRWVPDLIRSGFPAKTSFFRNQNLLAQNQVKFFVSS